MTTPVVDQIPHRLGREEAVRRLKTGFGNAQSAFGGQFVVSEETWTQQRLDFRATVLGQATGGAIDVAEDHVRIELQLPWMLGMIAEQAKAMIQRQGQLLLEKK
jgi:hypothetical protein